MENQDIQQITEQSITRYSKHRDEILRYQKQKYRELRETKLAYQKEYNEKKKDELQSQIIKIQKIMILDSLTNNFNDEIIEKILEYFGIEKEDDYDLDELYNDLKNEYNELQKELKDTEITDDELRTHALNFVIDTKLHGFINNYVLESTPLGNIYMRYNHSKKTFEYFSNNTIPYRYLEAVCRKYVMTFRCKKLYIDLDEEIKKALLKDKDPPKNIIKKYNINQMSNQKTNQRTNTNIKTNNDTNLLKENANRYTWEGRMSNLSLLKKVDKQIINKNYSLSFADYKKIQQKV